MITAGAQIVDIYELWDRLFSKFQIALNANVICHLKRKDMNEWKRQNFQKTKD